MARFFARNLSTNCFGARIVTASTSRHALAAARSAGRVGHSCARGPQRMLPPREGGLLAGDDEW